MKIEIVCAPFSLTDEDFAKEVAKAVRKPVVKKPSPGRKLVAGFKVGEFDVFGGTITCPETATKETAVKIIRALGKYGCQCEVIA